MSGSESKLDRQGDRQALPRLRLIAAADEKLRPVAADALAHLGDAEGLLELLNADGFAAAVDSVEALFELPDQPVRRRELLLRDTAIPRVRILAELYHGPPQRLPAKNHELVRQKLLEVLAKPDASPQEQIEAARALKAEFPFGTLLRAVFKKVTI